MSSSAGRVSVCAILSCSESFYLANILQNVDCELQISNVKSRQGQSDVAKMSVAEVKTLVAGVAGSSLARSSLDNRRP